MTRTTIALPRNIRARLRNYQREGESAPNAIARLLDEVTTGRRSARNMATAEA